MNTKKLQVLLTVIDEGSFTKAGDVLQYTQSGITQMMKTLEQEIGFPLFIKSHHGVTPTPECERILPSIRQLLVHDEKLSQEISFIHGLQKGVLRIGSYASCASTWLPHILPEFQEKYPNIHISIVEGGEGEITQWIYDHTVDIGLLSTPARYSFDFIPLVKDPMVVVLPQDHPLCSYKKIPITALEHIPFIASDASFDQDVHSIIKKTGVKPDIRFTSKNDYTILSMVEHGLGVSILPELIVKTYTGNYEMRPLDPNCMRTLGIGLTSKAEASPASAMFIKALKEQIK